MSLQEQTCIDLFCGCGGLTLGMQRAGFRVLAAIDSNSEAVETLRANLVEQKHSGLVPVAHALQQDLSKSDPSELAALLGVSRVDVIVGGPPCQGFSTARRVDGANNGARLKADPRRELYRDFLRYVDFLQPCVFVIENVLGIRSAMRLVGGGFLAGGYRCQTHSISARFGNYGNLITRRKRRAFVALRELSSMWGHVTNAA